MLLMILTSCQSASVTPGPGGGKGAYGVFTELGKSVVPNDIVTVSKTTRFYLGHQNGNSVAGVLLQAYNASVTTSTNRVFDRLVVERL
jgi:hypothetical protein